MIANVIKGTPPRGLIGGGGDLYLFDLEGDNPLPRWVYKGKIVGETFIRADRQGYEHIPQEFYAALDRAWHAPNSYVEFEDPMESLEVQGA